MRLATAMFSVIVPISLLVSGRSPAQDAQAAETETLIKAQPLTRVPPTYPGSALRYSQEGWVALSFIISPSGEVVEPMIEDSSGVEAFEQAALAAISRWRYTPATLNGEPVEQSMVQMRITFAVEDLAKGATRPFVKKYQQIRALLESGDYAAAEPQIEEIESGGRANLYEDALFWSLKYGYLEVTGSTDTDRKLRALERAMGYQEDYLPPDSYLAVAQRLYVLQAQTADLSAARATFERLRDSRTAKRSPQYEQTITELTPSYQAIEQLVAGQELLVMKAEIDTHDYWVHDLLRRSFSMAEVTGRVDSLSLRCDRGTKQYESFPENAVWQVPEDWGQCAVYIKGEPETTFVFREHPLGTPATVLTRR